MSARDSYVPMEFGKEFTTSTARQSSKVNEEQYWITPLAAQIPMHGLISAFFSQPNSVNPLYKINEVSSENKTCARYSNTNVYLNLDSSVCAGPLVPRAASVRHKDRRSTGIINTTKH